MGHGKNKKRKRLKIFMLVIGFAAMIVAITLFIPRKHNYFNVVKEQTESKLADRLIVLNDHLTVYSIELYVDGYTAYYYVYLETTSSDEELCKFEFVYIIIGDSLQSLINLNWPDSSKELMKDEFNAYYNAKENGKSKIYTKEEICALLQTYDGDYAADGNSKEELLLRHQ